MKRWHGIQLPIIFHDVIPDLGECRPSSEWLHFSNSVLFQIRDIGQIELIQQWHNGEMESLWTSELITILKNQNE